ncbi:MAG: choice-of-anchor Q domain-containing protein [Candidatus Binatia bacterium]
MIGDAANACGLTNAVNGNLLGVDPHLGPLQNNGGPTQTMALLPGSPAIDAGDPNGCTDAAGNVLATDQRGAPRSVPGDTRCDIGAYEATWPAWATITPTPTATFTSTATITPTVTATLVSTSTRTPIIHTVAVDVGSTSGVPGQQVTFGVSLQSLNAEVAGLQNDIGFDASTPVAANADGSPACVANPAIGKEATAFAFVDCSGAPPEGCSWMRALVFSLTDQSPIPDGSLLYTCTVNISAHALPGDYALVNSGVIVAGPNGQELLADSANGSVNVVADPAAQSATGGASAPAAASGAGSGCSLTREPPPAGGGLVALALFVGLVGCRRARRRVRDRADPAPSAGAAHGL